MKPLLTVDGLMRCAIHMAVLVDLQVVAVPRCGRVQVGQATQAGAEQRGGIRKGSDCTAQDADQEPQAGPRHHCSLNGWHGIET